MKILINYADKKYRPAQKTNTWTGYNIAKFDKVYSFAPEDIEEEFREKNQEILKEKRGNGLWLWKPYFIKKIMDKCEDGDIIFYCDSGAFFIRNLQPVVDILENESVFVCDYPLVERCFTKPLCFKKMQCEERKYKDTNQIMATYLAVRCCKQSREFIGLWLQLCQDKELLWPESNMKHDVTNPSEFISHREDQSILSLLSKKYELCTHRDISQRGREPWSYYNKDYLYCEPQHMDRYQTILFVHKCKKVRLISIVKYYWLLRKLKKSYLEDIKK